MIYFNFNLAIPFWGDRWANVYNKSGNTPWKHKFWEFQVMKDAVVARIEFGCRFRTDHAGVNVGLGLLGYAVEFSFYDSRHWDDETNTYKVYND